MNKTLTRLEKLKAKQVKLAAEIQAAEARAKTSQRKQDARRKILIGAYYLEQARQKNSLDDLKKALDGYLKRNTDRKLFELPELEHELAE